MRARETESKGRQMEEPTTLAWVRLIERLQARPLPGFARREAQRQAEFEALVSAEGAARSAYDASSNWSTDEGAWDSGEEDGDVFFDA